MNTDIRLAVGFWNHPKTKRLIRACGLEGVRSLQILWTWAAQNRPDGSLRGMDETDIELAADWEGEEGAFFKALEGRFIDQAQDGYVLHDWEQHNPWVAGAEDREGESRLNALLRHYPEVKAEVQKRGLISISREQFEELRGVAKAIRNGSACDTQCDPNATPCDTQCGTHAERNAPYPFPNPNPSPNPEEEEEEEARGTADASALTSPEPPQPKPDHGAEREALLSRYSPNQREVAERTLRAIHATRKAGKIAPGVELAILRKWAEVDPQRLVVGCLKYLDGGHHLEGRDERYLWGIIRNVTPKEMQSGVSARGQPGVPALSRTAQHNLAVAERLMAED